MITERNVRFFAVVSMVALFVSGVAIGFAMARLLVPSAAPSPARAHPLPAGPLVDRFAREVGLRPDQREAVHAILEDGRARAQQIMEQNRPELERIRRSMEERIAALLDPDQAATYRELLRRGHHVPAGKPPGKGLPPPGMGSEPPPLSGEGSLP